MKQIASPGSMHDTGFSGPVHWDDPEGWDGMGRVVGGGFRMGNTCTLSGAARMRPVRDKVRNERGTCKAALPHTWLPWGPNMSPREPPG